MDNRSLDEIYRSYMLDVYRYLLSLCGDSHLAEDLVQETFFRAYLYIESLNEEKVKPWLFSVAHHAFIDHRRKQKRIVIKEDSFFRRIARTGSLENKIVLQEQVREVEQIISALPDKQRYAILLVDFHEMVYKEAASIMEVSLSHLKILLFRARQAVRRQRERNESSE